MQQTSPQWPPRQTGVNAGRSRACARRGRSRSSAQDRRLLWPWHLARVGGAHRPDNRARGCDPRACPHRLPRSTGIEPAASTCVGKMVTVPFWGCWRYGKSGPAGAAGRGAWMLPYGRRIRSRISLRCFSNMPRLSSSAWSNDSANSEGWPMSSACLSITRWRSMWAFRSTMCRSAWARWRITDRNIATES